MSWLETVQVALGGKAIQRAQRVVREPGFVGGPPGSYFAQKEAGTHSKAYGGGSDGIDWFYDGANYIARQAVKAPFHFEDEDGTRHVLRKGPDAPPEVKEVPWDLREIFTKPNPWMDWKEHMALLVIDLLSVGNGYWLKWTNGPTADRPAALYRLSPALIKIVPGKNTLIDHYEYGYGKDVVRLDPATVVHFRLPNPHSENSVLGLGMIQAAPKMYDIELGLVDAMSTFFRNGTLLSGVLETDRTLPEVTRRKVIREFRTMHQNARNWFNVAMLEKGLRYRAIQPNAQQAGFEALSKMSRDRILIMLGVPKIVLGIDDGNMKLQEGRRLFAEDTMEPFLDTLETRISWTLTQAWGLDLIYDYGYQMPEEDRIGLGLEFSSIPGVTVKEVRERAGLEALGPDFVDENGERIDDIVLNLPGPSTEGEEGWPDKADPDGGRPPDPENTREFPSGRTGDRINGRPASAADRRRRERTTGRAPAAGRSRRRPAVKGLSPDELAHMPVDLILAKHRAAARLKEG